ncbi:MAG: hypothetical protein V4655_10500 [Bdellovibrionota bacterium]
MNKVLKTFQTFMEDALKKSLPELTLLPAGEPEEFRTLLSARLSFEGKDMKAQAFLSCSDDFLQLTCPLPRGAENHSDDTIRDWLGELGNLILGRLKNRLLAHDVTIKISAPDFEGDWNRPTNAERVAVWFECESTMVGFECLVEGRVPEIGEALEQKAEILPGDAIYRLNDTIHSTQSMDVLSKIRSGVEDTAISLDEVPPVEVETKIESVQKPFQMHFHTAAEPIIKASVAIIGIAWPSLDHLQIKMSTGLEFTACPKTLLDAGVTSFELEGVQLQFRREGDTISVSLPKFHMNLSKTLRN